MNVEKAIGWILVGTLIFSLYTLVRYETDEDYRDRVDNPKVEYGVDSWIVEAFKN